MRPRLLQVRRIFANSERVAFTAGAALAVEPVRFLGVSAHRFDGHFRCHHPILQSCKNTLFKVTPCIVRVFAQDPSVKPGPTGITVLPRSEQDHANDAMDRPGKQRLRPTQAVQSVDCASPYGLGDIDILIGNFALTRFCRLPSSSSIILSSGTSATIHSNAAFMRDTRRPVLGSSTTLTLRFQTSRPTYSSLLMRPVPRLTCPADRRVIIP